MPLNKETKHDKKCPILILTDNLVYEYKLTHTQTHSYARTHTHISEKWS